MNKTICIVVSHTHWDREWYLTFQEYRLRLLKVMDKVVNLLLHNPRFKYFLLDGQSSIIEDYLELRPDRESVIKSLVSKGKLLIGPWYTQPDEALVSPESIIRNLLIGHRIAKSYGRIMKVGYLPDTFGHTTQLPQILRGFNIDSFIFMRGTGDEFDKMKVEFIYEAPDGSRVLACYLVRGYCNANMLGLDNPYKGKAWRSPDGWRTVFLDIYYREQQPDMEKAYRRVKEIVEFIRPKTVTGVILLMNGCDHQPPQEYIYSIIKFINSRTRELYLYHGTLEEYVEYLRRSKERLKIFRGELRGAKRQPILAGVLSSRIYLKQLNYRSQILLENYAEPLSTISYILGFEYPYLELLRAWKDLLRNQAHDSIYGSSTDQVHLENEARFQNIIEIGSNIAYESALKICEKVKYDEEGILKVWIFNPLNWRRTDYVRAILPIPSGDYVLVEPSGKEYPVQVLKELDVWGKCIEVLFVVEDMPPLGYKVLHLIKKKGDPKPSLRIGKNWIENEYFRVYADPERGGALTILDKTTGRVLRNLNVFVDEGDAGDEYNYSPPREKDLVIESTEFKSFVESRLELSRAVLTIFTNMKIPRKLEGQRRSQELIDMPIEVEVSLYPGVKRVDVKVELDNTAEDHRFRVKFPISLNTEFSYADSHFYVVKRPIKPASEGKDWVESPPTTHPQLYWVEVTDGKYSLMVANRGLPEYEVRKKNGDTIIYLTLFRAVGWLSRGDLLTRKGHAGPHIPTPGAQCKRRMVFEYAIIPHWNTWSEAKAYKLAREFAIPLFCISFQRGGKELPREMRFIEIKPDNLIVTALKKSEDDEYVVLRFYNILPRNTEAEIFIGFDVEELWLANLNEEPISRLRIEKGMVKLNVEPHKIITLLIKPIIMK